MNLSGKTALVTGASRGIGRAIASRLARDGACVLGTATTPAGADGITEEMERIGAGRGFVLDVSDAASIENLFEQIKGNFDDPLILVNNAAITRDNLALRMKPEEWNAVIETNLTSVFRLTRHVLRAMTRARWGRIISISSVVGSMGNPGQTNYAAAKAGLQGFSRSLAAELGSRAITVNCVAPGFIDTDMTRELTVEQRELLLARVPLGRLGSAEEIAELVAFLAGDASGYITGETIHINGGMYMS